MPAAAIIVTMHQTPTFRSAATTPQPVSALEIAFYVFMGLVVLALFLFVMFAPAPKVIQEMDARLNASD